MPLPPRDVASLLRPLNHELLALLRALDPADWARPTVAPAWRVHDVVAHLLDVSLRKVSAYRDAHRVPSDAPIASERDLARFINGLNAAGVAFGSRMSPRVLVDLLAVATEWAADLAESLPPDAPALFAVSWAGEEASAQWMDTGREYTEFWHHQMQLRDATGAPPLLLEPRWMDPLLDFAVRALPHGYRDAIAPAGTMLTFTVEGDDRWAWTLVRGADAWRLDAGAAARPATHVRATADAAWRLLFNAPWDPSAVSVSGDERLAAPLLRTRSVIV